MNSIEHTELINKYQNGFTQGVNDFINKYIATDYTLFAQIIVKVVIIIAIFVILDVFFNMMLKPLFDKIAKKSKSNLYIYLQENKVFGSILHLIPMFISYLLTPYIFYHHPFSFDISHKLFSISIIMILMLLLHRILQAVEDLATDDNNYRSIAVNSFGQMIRIVGIFIMLIILISILFDIRLSQILTAIGAIMAVFLLVFRDPILGFVAGIHASSSQMVKKGDWIVLPKYSLEGYVEEINLMSVKIRGFDNSISTIPTYDIVSSELKSNEYMLKSDRRLIKRSVYLNINSFRFLSQNDLDKFIEYPLIKDYIKEKVKEGKILTNVGLFRIFVYNFLLNNDQISTDQTLLVRQREISPQGLPIEIFCFTRTSEWMKYENIQSDVFDFVLTSAKDFGLEVVQTGFKA